MPAYPHERQIEYWTSRAIEDYFDNEGYTVTVLPNSPRVEKYLPYDHLFAGKGIKIFGFQYKRFNPGVNGDDYWDINIAQFHQLKKFSWIYYALPQVSSIKQRRNALHLLVVVSSDAVERKVRLSSASHHLRLATSDLGIGAGKVPYFRWGGFVRNLFKCNAGWKPETVNGLKAVFYEARDVLSTMVDLYIVSLSPGIAIRMTPFITDIDDLGDNFDFGIER